MTFCSNCGKQGDEVDEFCRSCGTSMSREMMDVVYETERWNTQKRIQVEDTLVNNGIPHEWDGGDMTVAGEYEKVVDYILAQLPTETQTETRDVIDDPHKWRLFKSPLYADWCIWLGSLAVISGVIATADERGPNAILYILAIAVQWTIFSVCPAGIRREINRRRERRLGV